MKNRLLVLASLTFTLLPPATASAQTLADTVVLSSRIGEVINQTERAHYHLFPVDTNFVSAIFFRSSDGNFFARVTLLGPDGKQVVKNRTYTAALLLQLAEKINHYEDLVADNYTMGKDPATIQIIGGKSLDWSQVDTKYLRAQDTAVASEYRAYRSIGFQVSTVSGIGISYGINEQNNCYLRATGGLITTSNQSYYSFGIDCQYELTKNKSFKVFIGLGCGIIGDFGSSTHPTLGLGTGIEAPVTGSDIFENVTVGGEIYCPTIYFSSGTISLGVGIFTSYNF
ncbi:MAG: hypothetical protein KGJ59_11470 [Bacteroidota bacterium]|nr:hypothetical protein [Bacteroidota bacterium]